MGKLRRYYIPNTPISITSVTWQRRPYLRPDEHKARLLSVMRLVKRTIPYRMLGYVILDDHFHWIITPDGAEDYPRIMQSVKQRIARELHISPCWQRRYWDHIIRDKEDLHRHLDYIHYNPVKHGHIDAPCRYRWSSFGEYLTRWHYTENWGIDEEPTGVRGLVPE